MSSNTIELKEELQVYLPRLEKGLISILNKLKNGQEGPAFDLLTDAIEGLSWTITSLDIINSTIVDSDEFQETLETMLDAMENRDIDTIADVIEFELLDVINDWADKLE
ncbi:MAG: hypothetical protein ATN31_03240 [Candidatus Epulonipiscioides saccharophilum]|nr:MAG: hypothetical protein ATN31_03240 [Epulopiscium sp. AS2M-Bin001]